MMDSIWSQTCQIPERAPLEGDIETEVAVIGAGMAGVLIASALQDAGERLNGIQEVSGSIPLISTTGIGYDVTEKF